MTEYEELTETLTEEEKALLAEKIKRVLAEDDRRMKEANAPFNPISGLGSVGARQRIRISDYPGYTELWLPVHMLENTFVKRLVRAKSISAFIAKHIKPTDLGLMQEIRDAVIKRFIRIRNKHDFPFWAATFVMIKPKKRVLETADEATELKPISNAFVSKSTRPRIKSVQNSSKSVTKTGKNVRKHTKNEQNNSPAPKAKIGRRTSLVHFWLNRPQRIMVEMFERMRLAHLPIRIVVLKARQWGGSTCIQMYMAWLQLVHYRGADSAIEAHQNQASANIQKMFKTMLDNYPTEFLHETDEDWNEGEKKYVGDSVVRNIIRIPSREFEIQVGSAMQPDASRSANIAFAHCSEVAIWPDTGTRTPQKLVNAVCSGILPEEGTFIAYESTAKGETNWFHDKYVDARNAMGKGDQNYLDKALFIAWFQIENYTKKFDTEEERHLFAARLIMEAEVKDAIDSRHEPGAYLWRLHEMGATLDAINWYIFKRTEYNDHADIANEYPSDDIEAFRTSGCNVFDIYEVEKLEKSCKDAKWIGDLHGKALSGAECLKGLRFKKDPYGCMKVWEEPEDLEDELVTDRYLVSVDIGGRWSKADWSVITVFDRYWMMEGGKPAVVAQWYGHIDHDLLAWKAAQIAKWYQDALLVIESNTLEKDKNKEGVVKGDEAEFILNEIKGAYDNLYARKQSAEDIREGLPKRYGFHTNMNTKPAIIDNLIRIVREQGYTEREKYCLDEYKTYQLNEGVYEAAPKHHDDLLMTRAIGLWVCYKEMPMPKLIKKSTRGRMHGRVARVGTEAQIV